MLKRPTTITYVDTDTGRTHRVNAEVSDSATRKEVAATLERHNGMAAGRIRIVSGA